MAIFAPPHTGVMNFTTMVEGFMNIIIIQLVLNKYLMYGSRGDVLRLYTFLLYGHVDPTVKQEALTQEA